MPAATHTIIKCRKSTVKYKKKCEVCSKCLAYFAKYLFSSFSYFTSFCSRWRRFFDETLMVFFFFNREFLSRFHEIRGNQTFMKTTKMCRRIFHISSSFSWKTPWNGMWNRKYGKRVASQHYDKKENFKYKTHRNTCSLNDFKNLKLTHWLLTS